MPRFGERHTAILATASVVSAITVSLIAYAAYQYLRDQTGVFIAREQPVAQTAARAFRQTLDTALKTRLTDGLPGKAAELAAWALDCRGRLIDEGVFTVIDLDDLSVYPTSKHRLAPDSDGLNEQELELIAELTRSWRADAFLGKLRLIADRQHRIECAAQAATEAVRSNRLDAAVIIYRNLMDESASAEDCFWHFASRFRLAELQTGLVEARVTREAFRTLISEASRRVLDDEGEWSLFFARKALESTQRLPERADDPREYRAMESAITQASDRAQRQKELRETAIKEHLVPAFLKSGAPEGDGVWLPLAGGDTGLIHVLERVVEGRKYLLSFAPGSAGFRNIASQAAERIGIPKDYTWVICRRDGTVLAQSPGSRLPPRPHFLLNEPIGDAAFPLVLGMALPDEARNVMRQRARGYLFPLLIAGVLMLASLAFLVRSVRLERSMAYMKNELVAKAAHNIKTPLGLLRVYIDALQAGEIVDKTQERKYLAVLKRECDRLCAITENLLSFSQVTMSREDREPFARDVIDLSKVVNRIADVFQEAGVAVRSEGSGEVLIAAQEAEVETAIYNLMDNARKYSSPGSSIHMTLAVHGTTANLAIRDYGIGFAPKDLANLGTPFYRGDTETVRRNKGLGLGLAVAVQIVERYGGRLTVAPGDGGGSVVRIVFPLHRKDGVKS